MEQLFNNPEFVRDEIRKERLRRLLRSDLVEFSKYFFEARGDKFIVNHHHLKIRDALKRVVTGETKNLLINMPPRYGKSELAVICFIAYSLALNPKAKFIHLSYSDELALENSSKARELIRSDEFQELWPIMLKEDADSKKKWYTTQGGGLYATSSGGPITGFGAGATKEDTDEGWFGCFVAGTKINTDYGSILIDEIKKGDIVLSYNHKTRQIEPKEVLGVKVSIRSDLVDTQTKSGAITRSTQCHRFFDGKSYKKISDFSVGDTVYAIQGGSLCGMPVLQENIQAVFDRDFEKHEARGEGDLLLKGMFFSRRKFVRQASKIKRDTVSCVLDIFSAAKPYVENVFCGMRGLIALSPDARNWKLELSECKKRPEGSFQENEASDTGTRWQCLLDMFLNKKNYDSPHGREQVQRCAGKFSYTLSGMSCDTSQITCDTISSLERVSAEPAKVYDIEVAGNNNFFAEGILVHNCIIIDDPLKVDDAESKGERDRINERLNTTIKSRRNSRRTPIIIIMQRLHEDDMSGFVLAGGMGEKFEHLKMPAIQADGTPLWAVKHTIAELEIERAADPFTFSGQMQQEPSPDDGTFFKKEWFKRFDIGDEPEALTKYGASDYAVSEGQGDFTELGIGGFDCKEDLWLVDWWSGQTTPDKWINEQIALVKRHDPIAWVAEGGMIRRSVEPFLNKEMREQRCYFRTEWLNSNKNKSANARSFQALASQGKVHIPNTDWGNKLLFQLLQFPAGKFDDAVDVCGLFGRLLDQTFGPRTAIPVEMESVDAWGWSEPEQSDWKIN